MISIGYKLDPKAKPIACVKGGINDNKKRNQNMFVMMVFFNKWQEKMKMKI